MDLPFTSDAFLEVFARYNTATWPGVVALWLASLAVSAAVICAPGRRTSRAVVAVLAALWAWSGVVYHAWFFAPVNPAAEGFAVLFVMQAVLILRAWSSSDSLSFGSARPGLRALGLAFLCYGMAYPGLVLWLGHSYPRMPTYGVPCPTMIVTTGLLLTCARVPRRLLVVPVLWGLIGGSAAFQLGMAADYALPVGAAALVVAAVMQAAQRPRPALPSSA